MEHSLVRQATIINRRLARNLLSEIPTADVKRSIFNSVLTALKISRCMLTDIYTNKTQQTTAVRLTESTNNILDLLLDLLSISVLLNIYNL